MNIGLIGSGGREHALCKKIYDSNLVNKIFCFPGNAGTSKLAINVSVDILNFKKILKIIKLYKLLSNSRARRTLGKRIVNYLKNKMQFLDQINMHLN